MAIGEIENKMDSKCNFHECIAEYYNGIAKYKIPDPLLSEIIMKVTNKIYEDYQRFWNHHPKSRKRYSKLLLDDLEHSFIYYLISDYLKLKDISNYRKYSKILFRLNDEEFDSYEVRKYQYETK